MSILLAGYILQRKVASASSSGSLGFIVCVKCCRMVDDNYIYAGKYSQIITDLMIPPFGQERSHGKTQYIPGKQVLVKS